MVPQLNLLMVSRTCRGRTGSSLCSLGFMKTTEMVLSFVGNLYRIVVFHQLMVHTNMVTLQGGYTHPGNCWIEKLKAESGGIPL